MRKSTRFLFAFLLTALFAAPAAVSAEDLNSVLARLNVAAKKFRTVSANVVYDIEQTDPIPETDTQKAKAYYERKGGSFKMAAHIYEYDGHPVTRAYNFSGGAVHFYDGTQEHVYKNDQLESYLIMGFGASGDELAAKWNIKYIGSQVIDGVNVAQLELVAKDPQVRKNLAKVTLWIDPDRGISLQQRFDESSSLYRICKYTDIKVNETLPRNAFDLK